MPFTLVRAQVQSTQTVFGKNRVQFSTFDWSYFRNQNFDTYFYQEGRELAVFTSRIANDVIKEVEETLNYRADGRYMFVVYLTQADLQQTNLGLDLQQYNTGGLTLLRGNKIPLYFNGNREDFIAQMRSGIAKVLLFEMLYGGNITEKVQSSTLLYLPDWFVKGFFSFTEKEWNVELDNQMRELILSGKIKKFNHLLNLDPTLAGHSFWNFVANSYGKSNIPNIMYLTNSNRDFEAAFAYILGKSLKTLNKEWFLYYKDQYVNDEFGRKLPNNEIKIPGLRKNTKVSNVKLSPDGSKLIYVTHKKSIHRIMLYDFVTKKSKVLHKSGLKHSTAPDQEKYPIVDWHPSGRSIAYFFEIKDRLNFGTIKFRDDKKPETNEFPVFRVDEVNSMSFDPSGISLVISASKSGQSDIFIFQIPSKRFINVTLDNYDDYTPSFFDDKGRIIFSSNRPSDSLVYVQNDSTRGLPSTDLFLFTPNDSIGSLQQITFTPGVDEKFPFKVSDKYFAFLSDKNGIINRHYGHLDSVEVLLDDTTQIWKEVPKTEPGTDYPRNLENYHVNQREKVLEVFGKRNKKFFYVNRFDSDSLENLGINPVNTNYRTTQNNKLDYVEKKNDVVIRRARKSERKESEVVRKLLEPEQDTSKNQNGSNLEYSFQVDLDIPIYEPQDTATGFDKLTMPAKILDPLRQSRTKIYETATSSDYFVTQFGNSLFNSDMPNFVASTLSAPSQRNGIIVMAGASDLFEDYKFSAGSRNAFNLNSNEYFLMFEALKKRVDKKILFHQLRDQYTLGRNFYRLNNVELMGQLIYPFNQHAALKGGAIFRYDRTEILASDFPSLNQNGLNNTWLGGRVEYVFDNSQEIQLNILKGTRYKFFAEAYQSTENKGASLGVIGFDFRHYAKIHKNFIFANRVAFNGSFGSRRMYYRLGGVDNWLLPRQDENADAPNFDEVAFPAFATNMRGFGQGVRNGNNYFVYNAELRFPIFSFISKSPISSDFLRNFQIVPFFDVGTAWSGLNPFSLENPFNTKVYENGPVKVIVYTNKNPILVGYGSGIHARLFGYFIRYDLAWGIDDGTVRKPFHYFSLSLDF